MILFSLGFAQNRLLTRPIGTNEQRAAIRQNNHFLTVFEQFARIIRRDFQGTASQFCSAAAASQFRTLLFVTQRRQAMNREELWALCLHFANRQTKRAGTVTVTFVDPTPEIISSYHHGEISESEKNSLLVFVGPPGAEESDEDMRAGCACEDQASGW
ncbi:MAG: hypothetical protein DWI25_08835 [Planctomycetota bacterium]|nr:MAG: hypothetical protein DWI25_08835 [Planctomycetota bacterium]